MTGKEFLDYLKKLPEESAVAIIDDMNKTANDMTDKIIKYESIPAKTLVSQPSELLPYPFCGQVELQVLNFLADKLKNDNEYYQKIKVILRKIIQETMTHYVTQISQKKYLSNIDFHHLPNSCAMHILNDFKDKSQKYL